MASRLHLPSLTVSGFRGIRDLELPTLGHVTLLAGKNSVGKSTILEAIRVFASRGDLPNLTELLDNSEEFVSGEDEDGDTMDFPDFSALFHNRCTGSGNDVASTIQIAAHPVPCNLTLELIDVDDSPSLLEPNLHSKDFLLKALRVSVGEYSRTFQVSGFRTQRRRHFSSGVVRTRRPEAWPDPIAVNSVGPGLLGNREVARLWDEVALTTAEEFVINALQLVVGEELERIAVVGDPSRSYRSQGRRAVAKLSYSSPPIPLKRLGDGAQRLFGISLALANCQNGILVIDEVENGIHHSIHRDLWRMIFRAAAQSNIQIVAATHSSDCIASFAMEAVNTSTVGTLYRLERIGDYLRAVHYSEEDLEVAARQRIEVR